MQVICIANQKGGAGKTTLTFNLGCMLGEEFNKRILLVDVDGQANLTTTLDFNPDEMVNDISSLLTKKDNNVREYIKKTKFKNVDLIPSSQHAFSAEKQLLSVAGREFILSGILRELKDDYDIILIDIPPNLGVITLNSLIASNGVVLVYTASEFALDGLSQILNTVDEIQENVHLNINNLKILGFIQNRFKSTTKVVNFNMAEAMEGIPDINKRFASISDTTEIEKSQFEHVPIHLFNQYHKVADQFRQFARELLICLV